MLSVLILNKTKPEFNSNATVEKACETGGVSSALHQLNSEERQEQGSAHGCAQLKGHVQSGLDSRVCTVKWPCPCKLFVISLAHSKHPVNLISVL